MFGKVLPHIYHLFFIVFISSGIRPDFCLRFCKGSCLAVDLTLTGMIRFDLQKFPTPSKYTTLSNEMLVKGLLGCPWTSQEGMFQEYLRSKVIWNSMPGSAWAPNVYGVATFVSWRNCWRRRRVTLPWRKTTRKIRGSLWESTLLFKHNYIWNFPKLGKKWSFTKDQISTFMISSFKQNPQVLIVSLWKINLVGLEDSPWSHQCIDVISVKTSGISSRRHGSFYRTEKTMFLYRWYGAYHVHYEHKKWWMNMSSGFKFQIYTWTFKGVPIKP